MPGSASYISRWVWEGPLLEVPEGSCHAKQIMLVQVDQGADSAWSSCLKFLMIVWATVLGSQPPISVQGLVSRPAFFHHNLFAQFVIPDLCLPYIIQSEREMSRQGVGSVPHHLILP